MSTAGTEDAGQSNRAAAARFFNASWDRLDRPGRTEADLHDALAAAFASREHWLTAGGPGEELVAAAHIASVAALLGDVLLARFWSDRAVSVADTAGLAGWRLAAAHLAVAQARACAGDVAGRDASAAEATRALEGEPDPEDRQILEEQVAALLRGATPG